MTITMTMTISHLPDFVCVLDAPVVLADLDVVVLVLPELGRRVSFHETKQPLPRDSTRVTIQYQYLDHVAVELHLQLVVFLLLEESGRDLLGNNLGP